MKKRVLIIGPGMEIGGVERSLLGLLDSINYEEFDVDLFLMDHSGELMQYINKNVNLLPESNSLSLINKTIIDLIKEGHFYIASVRLISKVYGDTRAKVKKTQTINTTLCKKIISTTLKPFRNHYDYALGFFAPHYILTDKVNADIKIGWAHTDYSNIAEKPDISFILPMWSKVDYIACVSNSANRSFQNVFPSLANRTVTIENIVSPSLIRKQSQESCGNEIVHDDCITVLSIGRLCTAKAFDLIPEVCSILIKKGYKIRWYIIGFGQDEGLIREKINEYSMDNRVILLGKKINPYPYIKACDIYAQPSRYEGKAVTVTEAQILNKPVIITRYNTSSSQVEEGVDGFICELGVDGIANGIAYLIDHPEFRKQLIKGTQYKTYDNSNEINKIWGLSKH